MVRSFENVSMISDCELFDTGRDILVSWVGVVDGYSVQAQEGRIVWRVRAGCTLNVWDTGKVGYTNMKRAVRIEGSLVGNEFKRSGKCGDMGKGFV